MYYNKNGLSILEWRKIGNVLKQMQVYRICVVEGGGASRRGEEGGSSIKEKKMQVGYIYSMSCNQLITLNIWQKEIICFQKICLLKFETLGAYRSRILKIVFILKISNESVNPCSPFFWGHPCIERNLPIHLVVILRQEPFFTFKSVGFNFQSIFNLQNVDFSYYIIC